MHLLGKLDHVLPSNCGKHGSAWFVKTKYLSALYLPNNHGSNKFNSTAYLLQWKIIIQDCKAPVALRSLNSKTDGVTWAILVSAFKGHKGRSSLISMGTACEAAFLTLKAMSLWTWPYTAAEWLGEGKGLQKKMGGISSWPVSNPRYWCAPHLVWPCTSIICPELPYFVKYGSSACYLSAKSNQDPEKGSSLSSSTSVQ